MTFAFTGLIYVPFVPWAHGDLWVPVHLEDFEPEPDHGFVYEIYWSGRVPWGKDFG